MPCTTILIGKKASYDGSTIIARNEDSGNGEWNPKKFVVLEPQDQPRHYRSVLSHVELDLPDDPLRYTSVPEAVDGHGTWAAAGVNAANVAMNATETLTSNPRVLGADPLVVYKPAQGTEGEEGYVPEQVGGLGEEDLVTLTLPYIRSAREGVLRLGELLETYGTYEMNGIAFSDVDDIWWLETVGGHHWIARRVPEDVYVTMPNQLGIDDLDLTDALGVGRDNLCSLDLADFIEANHLDLRRQPGKSPLAAAADLVGEAAANFMKGVTGDATAATGAHVHINPRDLFGSHTVEDHKYNTCRAWDMQRWLNPRSAVWDGPHADFTPDSDDIPWCRKPERLLTIEDVKDVLSLHYQGTPYDPYGRGGDPELRGSCRPIGINRTSELSVQQISGDGPEATRALQWLTYGSNAYNALAPFFVDIDRTPEYLANTTGAVDSHSYYWANRLVAALADAHPHECAGLIETYQEAVPAAAYPIVARAMREVAEQELDYEAAAPVLEKANDEIAAMLEDKMNALLAAVLEESSNNMTNKFARSDA